MRYLNWDVLLFPVDSRVPIQEFRTACYAVLDSEIMDGDRETDRQVPILTCFTSSQGGGQPFKVSIHNWDTPSFSKELQELDKPGKTLYHEARIIIDGILVAWSILTSPNHYPHIIGICKAGARDVLRWPSFHAEQLTHNYWNAGENLGRIKITIAEGYVQSGLSARFVRTKNVVTFSFQHAPLRILEANGIAWPNKDMWLQMPDNAIGLLSPCRLERQSQDPDLHSHSPLQQSKGLSCLTQAVSMPNKMRRNFNTLMPPPPLPTHAQQRYIGWSSSDFANDPFVDASSLLKTRQNSMPSVEHDCTWQAHTPSPRPGTNGRSFLKNEFPQPITLQTLLGHTLSRPASQQNHQNGSLDFNSMEIFDHGLCQLNGNQEIESRPAPIHTGEFGFNSSLPFPQAITSNLVSDFNKQAATEPIMQSLEGDDKLKENWNPSALEPRLRSQTAQLQSQKWTTENQDLGEIQNYSQSLDSPSVIGETNGNSKKSSTPAATATGEKRKRPTTSGLRPRKNPSSNSTPLSDKRAPNDANSLEDTAMEV